MSITLQLTTSQMPVFTKAMKAKKVKVKFDDNSMEIDASNYGEVSDAIAKEWYNQSMTEGKDERTLQEISQKLMLMEPHFEPTEPNPTPLNNQE